VAAYRLVPVLDDEPFAGLVPVRPDAAATKQVLVRLRLPVEDPAFELEPECRVDDRDRLYLAALREDRALLIR